MPESEDNMSQSKTKKQFSISVLLQLIFLTALIVGSWINLQEQLSLVRQDTSRLLEIQAGFHKKIEELDKLSLYYEYRLREIEKNLCKTDINKTNP